MSKTTKTLDNYLPKQVEVKSVQARVRASLVDATAAELDKRGNTWVEFIESSMQRFLEECGGKP